MMPGSRSKDGSLVGGCIGSAGAFALCVTAMLLATGPARSESANTIPPFASANFGWQSNAEDRSAVRERPWADQE